MLDSSQVLDFQNPGSPTLPTKILRYLKVLDNSSRSNQILSVLEVYAHLLRHLQLLYRIVVMPLRYLHIYTAKRTTSKDLTSNMPGELGFRKVIIIEKYLMGCFEIGGHKTSRLNGV